MRPPKLSDEQIVAFLREAEKGRKSVAELCREAGVTETSFYRWRRLLPDLPQGNVPQGADPGRG
jgi:transposase-like protein